MQILKPNFDTLCGKNRALASALTSYEGASVQIEQSKSGEPTFRHSGRLFQSAYSPGKEAASQAAEIAAKKPDWVLLFGLGTGSLPGALLEKGVRKILVYEPSLEVLSGVLATVDISSVLAQKDVEVHSDLTAFISRVREIDGFDTLIGYATTPYKTVFFKEFSEFNTRVNNAHTTNKVCIRTDIESRENWVENYFANIGSLPDCPPIDSLRSAFKGVPMIIAGAGPSLEKNAHLLKKAKGRAVIVAAITAYKPLLKHGVVPDFVIASEKVDLPEYFTYGEDDLKTRLILAEVSNPGMFEREVKEKFVFFNPYVTLSRSQAPLWGASYFPSTGGSVTTAACDMGVMFGCNPIVLVGQDLCFGENGTHAGGGVYIAQDVKIDREKGTVSIEEDYVTLKDKAKSSFDLLWLKGLDGKPVPSKFDWVTFHQWFENYAASLKASGSSTELINATEGGAFIEGMEHAALAQVLDRYVKEEVPIDALVSDAVGRRRGPDFPALSGSVHAMQMSLKEIGRAADAITREVSRLRKDLSREGGQRDAARRAGRVKRLEDVLFRTAERSPFIWETLMASICELKEYLRAEEKAGSNAVENDVEAVMKAYGKLAKACAKFVPVLAKAKEALEARALDGQGAEARKAV